MRGMWRSASMQQVLGLENTPPMQNGFAQIEKHSNLGLVKTAGKLERFNAPARAQ